MKKERLKWAAMAACLGAFGLGSCTTEEVANQGGEQEISKLRVITRTEGTSQAPEEGIVYLFNKNGTCTKIIQAEDLGSNKAISTTPGKTKLIAIGSNDLSVYHLPDMENATDSSIITLKPGCNMTDLMLKTDSTILNEGETTQINMDLNREVICINEIKIEKMPDDVLNAEMIIGPIYQGIKMNGKYTTETCNMSISLTKDTVTGNWTNLDNVIYALPSKGNPTLTLSMKTDETVKEYAYENSGAFKKNRYVKLLMDYQEGLITYLSSSLTAPAWEGTDSICFEFNDNYLVKTDSANYNNQIVAGKRYQSYYVVSNTGSGSAVLLRKKGEAGISSQEDMDAKNNSINKPTGMTCGNWRLPTLEECRAFLMACPIYQKDKTNRSIKVDEVEPGVYYCSINNIVSTIELKLMNGVRTLMEPIEDSGYDATVIYRPVIDISY